MIAPGLLFDELTQRGVRFFAGVPDSQLKEFCALVEDRGATGDHVIAANEGNAVALAAGHHLATGRVPVVYMQNSGLGNAINPLTSLASAEVYALPLLLIIGWRGEPGVSDEPQHVTQGRITRAQLGLLDIPHWVLGASSKPPEILDEVFASLASVSAPAALLVRKGTFEPYSSRSRPGDAVLTREDALRKLLQLLHPSDLVVATTGKTSRELFELRVEREESQRDFLTVGSMGHAASIAMGVALAKRKRRVICLDGDGSLLMHLGALAVVGDLAPSNFIHVLLNNGAHESVGGQRTAAERMDFSAMARAGGYAGYYLATDAATLDTSWKRIASSSGPTFLEVKIRVWSRANLGRPTSTPEQNKRAFMEHARD